MTINVSALGVFLSRREDQGFTEDVDAGFIDRIVHTGNGVAKVREVRPGEDSEQIYELAENNLEALREKDIDHINTAHAVVEYDGTQNFVAFQPYTVEPGEDDEWWSDVIFETYQEHDLSLDPKLENFGVQYNRDGEEIRKGYRDISDPVSVHTDDMQLAQELGITHEDYLEQS